MGRLANNINKPLRVAIGKKMKQRRLVMGMSLRDVGAQMGVSFQQIAKYESGQDALTLSRLFNISVILKKSPESFIRDIVEDLEEQPMPSQHQRMCIETGRNFLKIKNPLHQEAVHNLAKQLAKNQGD
jgi:transcriptional regulator with XRE-family HTH domain